MSHRLMAGTGGRVRNVLAVACLSLLPAIVAAQSLPPLQPGQIAPPEVVKAAGQGPAVKAGGAMIRAVPQGLPALSSEAEAVESTLVVSDNSGLVGLSLHELSVSGADPSRVEALVRQLLPAAEVRVFPALSLTMIRTPSFDDLAPLAQRLAAELPDAGVNAPVRWAPLQTQ